MPDLDKSPLPPGSMLEIGLELIDEGKFIKQVNAAIRKAYRNLRDCYLLCQPVGTNDEPDQQLIFDQKGRIIGGGNGAVTIDGKTGEVIDEAPPVAGRIAKQA